MAKDLSVPRTDGVRYYEEKNPMRARAMRVTLMQVTTAVTIIGMVLALVRVSCIDNRPRDFLMCAVCTLAGHSTVYSKGYSESAFLSMRIGMTPRQVEDLLGPPLSQSVWYVNIIGGPVEPVWSYSRPGKRFGDYWLRQVYFKDGIVHHIDRTYYID